MTFWEIVLAIGAVFCTGLLFLLAFLLVTRTRRHELEDAATLEIEEMKSRGEWNGKLYFLRRADMSEEADRKARMATNAGKELSEIEAIGRFVFLIGLIVGIVALIIYFKSR